jgi:hypothetical protein
MTRRGRFRVALSLIAAGGLVACGLGLSGNGTNGGDAGSGSSDSSGPSDAQGDALYTLDVQGDAPTDGTADASDAPVLIEAGCPAVCTGGCFALLGNVTCNISVTASTNGVTCPPGLDCRVDCNGTDGVCSGNITCPPGHACTVVCEGTGQSCDSPTIQANGASSLCLQCNGTGQSCDSVTCSTADCTTVCSTPGACNGTCGCSTVLYVGFCP